MPVTEQTKKNFNRWLRTLEGKNKTKYSQGGGGLRDSRRNTFCCLGVLCDIVPGVNWGDSVGNYRDFSRAYIEDGEDWRLSLSFLPDRDTFAEWLGLPRRAFVDLNGDQDYTIRVTKRAIKEAGIDPVRGFDAYHPSTYHVAALNDDGVPFEDIAKVLRIQYADYLP